MSKRRWTQGIGVVYRYAAGGGSYRIRVDETRSGWYVLKFDGQTLSSHPTIAAAKAAADRHQRKVVKSAAGPTP
jgi:hypothetical protein